MSSVRLILNSLLYHRRTNAAVMAAVMVATAVLTGALLVGDSMRGSLRELTYQRLGRIDQLLLADRFFDQSLAEQLRQKATDPTWTNRPAAVEPLILFPAGTMERPSESGGSVRASQVTVIGCGKGFWELGHAPLTPEQFPAEDEVVLNAPLAAELQAAVGDIVVLRLPNNNQVPAESPLGRRDSLPESLPRLRVIAIVPATGLGRFSLQPTQQNPLNAYLSLETLQEELEQEGRINAIATATTTPERFSDEATSRELTDTLSPTLQDYGLKLDRIERTFFSDPAQEQIAYAYASLTSDRMLLEEAAQQAALRAFEPWHARPIYTYLATELRNLSAPLPEHRTTSGIPYSIIAAVDWNHSQLGELRTVEGTLLPPLGEKEIALTQWAADDLQAEVGDTISVRYFEPETTHGQLVESRAHFTLVALVALTEPVELYSRQQPARFEEPPTLANDPDFTPTVAGVTDQATIDDWDAPFPIEHDLITSADDDYWAAHRTTPKAFLSLAAGRHLWASRFGNTTSLRIPLGEESDRALLEMALLEELNRSKEKLGFRFLPVKQMGLQASAGTTPFSLLYLGFSMFLIASAVILIMLLFRLGVERQAPELGMLMALGIHRAQATRLLLAQGLLVALGGGLLGLFAGVGYAALMLQGLRTIWVEAIVTPFLHLHIAPGSLAIGLLVGVGSATLAMLRTVRSLALQPPQQLMRGATERLGPRTARSLRAPRFVRGSLLILAGVLIVWGQWLAGEAQAGAFFGAGASLLSALLLTCWMTLVRWSNQGTGTGLSLRNLAFLNAARNPLRSTLTISLVASASFLLAAISAFRLAPEASGSGGFPLIAQSDRPLHGDLSSPEDRARLFGNSAEQLADATLLPLRLRGGDDASCRNLFQPSEPRLMGVSSEWATYFDDPSHASFSWAASAATTPAQQQNPWRLLTPENDSSENDSSENGSPENGSPESDAPTEQKTPIPVVLDKNTALYSLHLYGGIGETFSLDYQADRLTFRVVGLLEGSLLQGNLLIGEASLLAHFPEVSGYRYFLIDPGHVDPELASSLLEEALGEHGFDVTPSARALEDLFAVQNTYLSTFQSLGGLGLLLGTLGLAILQLRNVLGRRHELALLRATGLQRSHLARLVFYEHLTLLLTGIAVGILSATLTVAPHLLARGHSPPLQAVGLMLLAVLGSGLLAGWFAVRAALATPLLATLRGT